MPSASKRRGGDEISWRRFDAVRYAPGMTDSVRHVVMFSGGAGSYLAAKRVVQEHSPQNVTLLFADTGIEDEDLYRFLPEAAAALGCELVRIADGRTPWELFDQSRFIGNTRVDLCSRVLKREVCDAWLKKHCSPGSTVAYVGIDWSESHRFDRLVERKKPWVYKAPLCSPPYLSKKQMVAALQDDGIVPPRLYGMGFAHNNCGGFCVKAGQAHFAQLLKKLPDRYAHHERQEQALRTKLGKDVSILKDRRGGQARPLTLTDFRARIAAKTFDQYEFGGCGCFSD